MIFEHASVIDCHQDGLIPDPESWIFAGILLSIVSSFVVLCLIRMAYYDKTGEWLKFCRDKYCLDIRNGSFVSFTFMALLTIAYYIFRIAISVQLSKVNTATSICLIIWPVIIWFVVWHLNYVTKTSNCNLQAECGLGVLLDCSFYVFM
jgi:magnesium-transporting ATPase (P-type)